MSIKYLKKIVKVQINRPIGTQHPQHHYIYPVNYGFIPNTAFGDGDELDAYVLGEYEPLERFEGRVIAIIKRLDAIEDKLVVSNRNYTPEQIFALVEFQERFHKIQIII